MSNMLSNRKMGRVDPYSSLGMGVITEHVVFKVLEDCINCNEERFNSPYDLISEKYGTINVKSSTKKENGTGYFNYTFHRNKDSSVADYYFCIGFSSDKINIEYIWAIDGASFIKKSTFKISSNTMRLPEIKKYELDNIPFDTVYADLNIRCLDEFYNYGISDPILKIKEIKMKTKKSKKDHRRVKKVDILVEDDTSIPLKKDTRERLKEYGMKGESYDKILNKLMDAYSDYEREK